jgi:predicted transcriptional regulator
VASRAHRRVALLSIHPRFASAILQGEKTVELRRTKLPADVSHVVVYATSPVKTIVGWFEVEAIERDRPARLWRRHGRATGVSAGEFRAYFEGVEEGTAISVRRAVALKKPVELSKLWSSTPPQSFGYLDSTLATRVLRLTVPRTPPALRVPAQSIGLVPAPARLPWSAA